MPVRPRSESRAPTARNDGNTRGAEETSPRRSVSSATGASGANGAAERDARATSAVLGGLSRRAGPDGARGQGTVLGDGVKLRGGRLLVDGEPVVARAALARSGGAALLVAAGRIVEDGRPGHGPIAKLSATARRELVAELSPLVDVGPRGAVRASLQDVRARSGAFAILEETLLAMRAPSEQRAAEALAQLLVAAAGRERDAGLRVHMERRLGQLPDRVAGLDKTGALAATVEEMRVRRANERPLRQEWLKGAPPTLKVLASVQDEFWKSELKEYQKQGYEVAVTGHSAVAKKVIDGIQVEVHMQERDTDVLDGFAVRDADIILYTGHANLGGITKIAVDNAPGHKGGNGKTDKLVALFACRSKQNVDQIDRKFPGQHLLVSAEGTYGHDDRIVLHALIEGIAKNKTYAQIEMAAKREGLWESKNYFMPNETVALTGQHRVYVPDAKTAHGTSISMRPRESREARFDAAALPRGPVDDVTGWVNTIQGYWAEELGTRADKALHDKLMSGGWFAGTKNDPIVKLEDVTVDGEKRISLSVNAAYGGQDPDALAMMVTFATGKELVARGDPARSEHEKRMLGLGMVSSYVYFMVEYSDVADILLRQFAKTHGFPPGLSWPVVEKAINLDPKLDCSPKTLAALERGMEHVFLEVNPDRTSTEFRRRIGAALDVLKNSGSKLGLATHEAIVTGQVKVDAIDDLEKADYARIRRDYLKDGVNLPVNGHKQLGDHGSRAWRAITSDMNGYMWDDRIYVSPGLTAQALASTLVHEVNHVVNKSEEHYRGDKAVLAEEYRAFYAEALFAAQSKGRRKLSAEECREIKEGVIHDYGLKNVTVADVADVPPGIV